MSKFTMLSSGAVIGKGAPQIAKSSTFLSLMPRSVAKVVVSAGLSATLFISGCATQSIQVYQNTKPTLDMHKFFSGQINGWGMFQGRNGEVKKRFYVDIDATHEGESVIVLDEKFSWADGSKSQRIWRLTKQDDGSWKGTAGDVIGEATGEVVGNTLHWNYLLELPVEDKTYKVKFDDWMYLINEDVMLNRSVMTKFGVELGSVTLSMHRHRSDVQ